MNTVQGNATIFNTIELASETLMVELSGMVSEVLNIDTDTALWLIDSGATCNRRGDTWYRGHL